MGAGGGGGNPPQSKRGRRESKVGKPRSKERETENQPDRGGGGEGTAMDPEKDEGRKEGRKEMVVEVGECRAIRAKWGGVGWGGVRCTRGGDGIEI